MIIGVFITWIVGKFAILFLVLLVGGAITSFLPDTEKNLIFIVEGLPKLFFNIGGIGGFQLFPGGMMKFLSCFCWRLLALLALQLTLINNYTYTRRPSY